MDKMKNYKMYTEGNYFYIIDTITAKVYEAHKKNVLVVKDTEVKGIFRFKNVEGFKDTESVKLQNIQKESGVTYTASEFETFYKENTGNFSTPGAPGASAYQVWLDEGNTGTEQEFIDSLKGEKGDRGDMPLTEIDAYLGNFYNPSIVALNRRGVNDGAEIVRRLRYVQDDIDNLGYTPLLLMTPSFKAENKIYSVIPDDGNGDFTFSRNSSATYIEGGIIKTALPNVPRIQDGKILIEGQSTNLNTYSENFNQSWSKSSTTISESPLFDYSPNGITKTQLINSTANSSSMVRILPIGEMCTISAFIKRYDVDTVIMLRANLSSDFCIFDLTESGMTLSSKQGNVLNHTLEEYGNGWFRISATYSTLSNLMLYTNWQTGMETSVYVWGLQAETGSKPSSYIPTDGTIVTRLADIATVTPPTGVTEIIETIDGVEQSPITVIPPTYQIPNGEINKVIMK